MRKSVVFAVNDMNIGGTEKSLLNLLSLLPEDRFEITVLMLEKQGGYLSYLPAHVIVKTIGENGQIKKTADEPLPRQVKERLAKGQYLTAARLAFLYASIRASKNWNLLNQFALRHYKNSKQYDIAIAYAGPYFLLSELVLNKIQAKTKYQWIHFDISQLNIEKGLASRLFRGFNQIFCVSNSSRNSFIKRFPLLTAKTVTFENVINKREAEDLAGDADPYPPMLRENFYRILTVGRLSPEKGQHIIPEVCHLLTREKIEFKWYLVGDGPLKSKITKEAEKYNVTDKIIFLGTHANPFPYFKHCDIYVQTSLQEGYGITIAEAKLFAKPIVTTNVASAPDLITDQANGIITGFTAQDIYAAVLILLESPRLRASFSAVLAEEFHTDTEELIQKYFNNAE